MRINRTRRSQGLPHLAQLVEHLTVVGKTTSQQTSGCPRFKSGSGGASTAGYLDTDPFFGAWKNAEHPDVRNLAFRLFSEANGWDNLVVRTLSGEYTHLIGKSI